MSSNWSVYLACLICNETHENIISGIPDGWENRYKSLSDEDSFCPNHSNMTKFLDAQCSGCVSTFPDCPLHRAIFTNYPDITKEELKTIENGICPRRVNGFFIVDLKNHTMIDKSINKISEDGMIFANGVREYLKRWHTEYYNDIINNT